jgi:D-cysteine desulfhydrase
MIPTRLELARLPTPTRRLPRLSSELGLDLWAKRDDLTGLGLSGNKVRKLEFLLADAKRQMATVVITTGGIQSNHCRATAVAARQLGLRPVLLLRGEDPGIPDGNLLLDRLLGAELHWCTAGEYRHHRDERMQELAELIEAQGERPYIIPEGGSNALGAQAYVEAADEIRGLGFEHVFVAVGSGGTVAGLAMAGLEGHVHGIAVCDDEASFRARVEHIHREAGAATVAPRGWRIDDRFRGEAYGVASAEVWGTIASVARSEGLLLDPTYTGKAMHALVSEARAGRIGGRVLFWHTGGAFGLFGRGAEVPV